MYIVRAIFVWLTIILVESLHGTLRQMFLMPLIGDFPARRITFFTGLLLIFLISFLLIRWINAPTVRALFAIGFIWSALTFGFEVTLGCFGFGYFYERIISDYDISRGGLMIFGLLFMVFTPYLAAKAVQLKLERMLNFL